MNGAFEAASAVSVPRLLGNYRWGLACVVTLIVGLISCCTWLFVQSQRLLGDLTSLSFVR